MQGFVTLTTTLCGNLSSLRQLS